MHFCLRLITIFLDLGLNANLDGTIDIKVNATGIIDSGKIKLYEVSIPGLDIPGYVLDMTP